MPEKTANTREKNATFVTMKANSISVAIVIFLIIGCRNVGVNSNLIDIEGFIQERPDSALASLRQVDASCLQGNKNKALYSLLYSMALDKNYVDIASDSLIAPAVKYYSSHGDNYHRFLTLYYQGRVCENAKNYKEAIDLYLEAEKVMDNTVPEKYKSQLYMCKGRVYYHQFALDKMLEETQKSKEIAVRLENPQYYIRNALDIAAIYCTRKEYDNASEELVTLDKWLSERGLPYPIEYYESYLRWSVTNTSETAESIIKKCKEYISKCDSCGRQVNNLLVAVAMTNTGQVDEAEKAFSLCPPPADNDEYEKVKYYSEASALYQAKGDYQQALKAELKYQTAVENINLSIFNNDIRFLEERYQNAIKEEQGLRKRIWLSIAIALLLFGIVSIVVWFLKREQKYKAAVSDARAEYGFIKTLVEGGGAETNSLREELSVRMNALRPYLYNDKYYPSLFSPRKDIEHINKARKEMLKSVGMIYALSYPVFTEKLVGHGLSAEEVGLCALYVAGYSSKEMNDFLHTGSILHINGNIRKKIGSPVEGLKLHTWLNQLFQDSSAVGKK